MPSAVATTRRAAGTGRAFTVLVDDLRLSLGRTGSAPGRRHFLERSVKDDDLVTLGTTSGGIWWSTRLPDGRGDLQAVLGRVRGRPVASNALDRITDYEAFWINTRETGPAPRSPAAGSSRRGPGGTTASRSRPVGGSIKERVKLRWRTANLCTGTSCDGMVRARAAELARGGQSAHGSRSRPCGAGSSPSPTRTGARPCCSSRRGSSTTARARPRQVAASAREANAAVYFVDVRGLQALPGGVGSAADAESLVSEAGTVP